MARTISTQQRTSTREHRTYEVVATLPRGNGASIMVRREAVFLVDGVVTERQELPALPVPLSSLTAGQRATLASILADIDARADAIEAAAGG